MVGAARVRQVVGVNPALVKRCTQSSGVVWCSGQSLLDKLSLIQVELEEGMPRPTFRAIAATCRDLAAARLIRFRLSRLLNLGPWGIGISAFEGKALARLAWACPVGLAQAWASSLGMRIRL